LQTVPLLKDEADYFIWQYKIQRAANVAGVLQHLLGEIERPDPITEEYISNEALAQAIASFNLSDHLTAMTMHCNTAAETWKTIKNHFRAVSQANKAALRRRFNRVELKTTVLDLATEVRRLSFQLNSAEERITDADMTSTLLSALEDHPTYSVLITTLDNQDGLTFDVLVNRLLHEEAKKKKVNPQQDDALNVTTRTNTRRCYNCNQPGHLARNCTRNNQSQHHKIGGRSRFQRGRGRGRGRNNTSAYSANDDDEYAFMHADLFY
jgi:hypothetical protein